MVTYEFAAQGLPKNHFYTLALWPLGKEVRPIVTGLVVDEDGKFRCSDQTPDSNLQDSSSPRCKRKGELFKLLVFAARGEPTYVAVFSADRHFKAFSKVIAFPFGVQIERGHCSLSLERGDIPDQEIVAFLAGFVPHEELLIETRSGGESNRQTAKADRDGNGVLLLRPAVIGKTFGDGTIAVRASSCHAVGEFDWGTRAFEVQ
ncbi:MAG: hypothetical protein L0338_03070 [Acidobacteria bacterium]|nr:hypothetical protein [Acidobacteriota bacterium]